jgi:uncharacterized membrane protein YgaE (UPF0421/DUF939 family)
MSFRKVFDNIFYRNTVRVAVLASLGSAAAFMIGSSFPNHISPIIAAIISLTAIKSTFHDTVKETSKQVAGTIVGAIFGIILIGFIGFNVVTIFAIVVSSLLLGLLLKLEAQGGLFIAGTVILIAGPLLGNLQLVEERIGGVILGSVVAFAVSMFVVPSDRHRKALKKALQVGVFSAEILGKISKHFRKNTLTLEKAEKWLEDVDILVNKADHIVKDLNILYRDSRWSPRVPKEHVEAVMQQANIVYKNVKNVRTILISVVSALEKNIVVDDAVRLSLSKMLTAVQAGIVEQLRNAELQPRAFISDLTVEQLRDRRNRLASQLKVSDDTQAIILGSTLIHESNKIKNILRQNEH